MPISDSAHGHRSRGRGRYLDGKLTTLCCAQGQFCGSSRGARFCRAANWTIRIMLGRPVKSTARWKSRRAGERALRCIFYSDVPIHTAFPTPTREATNLARTSHNVWTVPEGRGFTGCGKILSCCHPEPIRCHSERSEESRCEYFHSNARFFVACVSSE